MKLSFTYVKSILFIVFALIFYNVSAQKAPTTQQGGLWAPQGIKIDGKLTEWGSALKAYNKTIRLWYTMANDDKYIYLAVKSDDIDYNPKILAGGISLSINTADKKKDKDAYVITFPVISRAGGGRGGRGRRGGGFGQQDAPDTAAIAAQQQQTLATGKQISAIGFKEITDTLISIYNEYGIKAAATIDAKGNYSAEIAIPLAMLNISADQKEIAYNIKVNGLQMAMKNVSIGDGGGGRLSISGNGGGGFGGGGGGGFGGGFGNRSGSDADDITAATDFWAKYTIAVNTGK